MLIELVKGELCIVAKDDLEYFFTQLPNIIETYHSKDKLPKQLLILLKVSGEYKQTVPFEKNSKAGQAVCNQVCRKMSLSQSEFKVERVQVFETFHIRIELNFKFKFVEITAKEISENIKERLLSLKYRGFKIKKTVLQEGMTGATT